MFSRMLSALRRANERRDPALDRPLSDDERRYLHRAEHVQGADQKQAAPRFPQWR